MGVEDLIPQVGDMIMDRTDRNYKRGELDPQPRLRVNLTTAVTLSTTWTRLNFAGTSTRNTNTFPVLDTGQRVWYDATNKLFRFTDTVDRNYDTYFNAKFSAANVLGALNLQTATVQMRFAVPSPTPVYFPLPDSDGCVDLMPVNLTSTVRTSLPFIVYANEGMRTYGLGVELRLSGVMLGQAKLEAADLIIYGR